MATTTYWVILVLYFAVTIGLGIYFSRKIKDTSGYYTTGRSMNAAVTGFSYAATQMSAGSVIGSPATIYKMGYGYLPVGISSTSNPWWTFLTIGERIRRVAERINATTFGDIYQARYGKSARTIYGLMILLFLVPMMVGQLKACGDILSVMVGLDYTLGMILAASVIIIYTWSGGMFAVAWTDLVQGLIMMAGMIALASAALGQTGGLTAMHFSLKAIDPRLVTLTGMTTALWAISNIFVWSVLQIGGAAHSVVRFLIPKDAQTLKRALGYAVVFMTTIFVCAAIIGLSGRVLLPDLKVADRVVPTLAVSLLHPVLGGLLMCAALGAIMSSVDSVLLLCSSAATKDLYVGLINPKATDKQQLYLGRTITVVLGIVPILLALKPLDAVQWLVALSFQILASALTVPVFCAVWWPKATRSAGIASMLSGVATAVIWYIIGWNQFGNLSNWPGGIWPGVIGTAVSALVMVVVSSFTAPIDQETKEIFYRP